MQGRYKVWQQLNISRMVSWKSLRFGMELRAFKFNSLQFFQFYTIICFRAEQIPDGERWGCAVDTNQLLYPDWSWLISGVGVAFVQM
jgi:hypothetical protein